MKSRFKLPNMVVPCSNCPFRKDCLRAWLGHDRAKEIANVDSFVCHKDNTKQCAGHMHLLEKHNIFYRMALMYKLLNLKNRNLIFDTVEQFIMHHSKNSQ